MKYFLQQTLFLTIRDGVYLSLSLTPKEIMTRNILKKTRKITLFAKASGMMPRNVVAAPIITEGPISPKASAIRSSLGMLGSCCTPGYQNREAEAGDVNKTGATQEGNRRGSSFANQIFESVTAADVSCDRSCEAVHPIDYVSPQCSTGI